MAFSLNLTKEELSNATGGYSALTPGIYGAQIYEVRQGKSSKGNEMWTIQWKVTDGQEGINRRIRAWYVLEGAGLFRTVALLKALDKPYPSKTSGATFEFPEADDLLGEQANIQIQVRTRKTVDDQGNDDEIEENNVGNVYAYDPDKVSSSDDDTSDSGIFL